MRVLAIYRSAVPSDGPPSEAHMAAMGAFMTEMAEAGILKYGGAVLSHAQPQLMSLSEGVFTSAKLDKTWPHGAGFGILQCASQEELETVSRRFLEVAGDGESEIWPLMDEMD